MKAVTLEDLANQYLLNLGINVSDVADTDYDYKNLIIFIDINNSDNLTWKQIKDAAAFNDLVIFDPEHNCTCGRVVDTRVDIEDLYYSAACITIQFATV